MGEYLASAVFMSALLGILSYSSYPSQVSERSMKIASCVLILYVVLNPVFAFSKDFFLSDKDNWFGDVTNDFNIDDSHMSEVGKEAFSDGIKMLLESEFGISCKDVGVFVYGFDFKSMKAEKIKIVLSGKSALADWRKIENRITELGLGECEVNIQLE